MHTSGPGVEGKTDGWAEDTTGFTSLDMKYKKVEAKTTYAILQLKRLRLKEVKCTPETPSLLTSLVAQVNLGPRDLQGLPQPSGKLVHAEWTHNSSYFITLFILRGGYYDPMLYRETEVILPVMGKMSCSPDLTLFNSTSVPRPSGIFSFTEKIEFWFFYLFFFFFFNSM